VNIALHDSLQLTEQISKYGVDGLDEAVKAYEALLLPRAKTAISESGDMDRLMFGPDAPYGLVEAYGAMAAGMADGSE
jgi:hypothetical protein